MSEVLIVRHGQACFGTDNYDRLSAVGWEQSRLLGQYFAGLDYQFDACFTGAMRRHRETLAGIRDSVSVMPEATELPGLNEYDFHTLLDAYIAQSGEVIDRNDSKSFYRGLRKALLAWSEGRLDGAAESWADFETRVQDTMAAIAEPEGRILVVTSGGASSAILRAVLGVDAETMIELNLQARNSAISYYFCKHGRYRLNSFNAVPHLEQPQYRHLISYT
jgi:broad specificity phosphatase PhoE